MSIKSTHPSYSKMIDPWTLGRDSYDGENAIKDAGTKYLPPTSGQIVDGQGKGNTEGESAYQAYKLRAVYPDIFKDAVEAAVGIMHKDPPKIELPKELESLRGDCTLLGESLEALLRKINARQLITGRLGLLADIINTDKTPKPVILVYNDLAIRNWDDKSENSDDIHLRTLILDESGYEMDNFFNWEFIEKYRLLTLVDNNGDISVNGAYASGTVKGSYEFDKSSLIMPNLMGTILEEIPFTFINSKDLSPNPDTPPLHGLANLCLAIYRGEADYRQNLFMQGQDTLVLIGTYTDDDETVRTGVGSHIDLPIGGDAKYIGVNATGLSEQREALKNDYKRAIQKSGQLLDATSREKESGEALRIRVAAQTATLPHIAKTGAAGLEKILKVLAKWYGADESQVKVTPNLNFNDSDLNGEAFMQIMQAKQLGAPLSEESLHEWMQDQGFTKQTYKDELERLSRQASTQLSPETNDNPKL